MKIYAVGKPETPPLDVNSRLRSEIIYYTSTSVAPSGVVPLANEYWIDPKEAKDILEEGVVRVASPLTAGNSADIEISEDAERLLEWALEYDVEHIVVKA